MSVGVEVPTGDELKELIKKALSDAAQSPKEIASKVNGKRLAGGNADRDIPVEKIKDALCAMANDFAWGVEKIKGDPPTFRRSQAQLLPNPVIVQEVPSAEGVGAEGKPLPTKPSVDPAVAPLLERIAKMRTDPAYPSWYVLPNERLDELDVQQLEGILERESNALELIRELGEHPEHPIFADLQRQLKERTSELEAAKQQVNDLSQRPTPEQVQLIVEEDRRTRTESVPAVTPPPEEGTVRQRWQRALWQRLPSGRTLVATMLVIVVVVLIFGPGRSWLGHWNSPAPVASPQQKAEEKPSSGNASGAALPNEGQEDIERVKRAIQKLKALGNQK